MIYLRCTDPDPDQEVLIPWDEYMELEWSAWAEEDLAEPTEEDLDPDRDEALRLALEEGRLDAHLHYLEMVRQGMIVEEVVR